MSAAKNGTLFTIQPDGNKTEQRFEGKRPALADFQKAVGGYIERVRIRYEGRIRDAFVNEDGLTQGLDYNPVATRLLVPPYNYPGAMLVGAVTVFVPDAKPKQQAAA